MTWMIIATYDGSKLIPDEPLPLKPGTRVSLTVHPVAEQPSSDASPATSFFDIALSMDLDGPSDWSSRVDHYLYGLMVSDNDEP
ncbi:hypothetical protein SAMN05216486_10276 [bacterium JGI 053]|nr:hypothetical protein SAMN05216486_10276 [bacterium JGI 053]